MQFKMDLKNNWNWLLYWSCMVSSVFVRLFRIGLKSISLWKPFKCLSTTFSLESKSSMRKNIFFVEKCFFWSIFSVRGLLYMTTTTFIEHRKEDYLPLLPYYFCEIYVSPKAIIRTPNWIQIGCPMTTSFCTTEAARVTRLSTICKQVWHNTYYSW